MSSRIRRHADVMFRKKREDFGRPVIAEFPDTHEPEWWEKRVERLYRETILPRLEGKARVVPLNEVEQRVLDKARAFLADYDKTKGES